MELLKTVKRVFFVTALSIVLFACATKSDVYKDIDKGITGGNYDNALAFIVKGQENTKKPIYPAKNAIMLYLDKGIIEHYAGKYKDSAQDLEEAERLIQEAYTKSVTADITSYIANDNTKDYPGEDYEDLYINVFSSLNYYHQGDLEGAGVEIRKLTEKLVSLSDKYASGGSKVIDWLKTQLDGSINPVFPKGKPVNFSNSALARYLSAIIYRGEGEADHARIDFVELTKAYAAAPAIYSTPLPASLKVSGEPGYETNEELSISQGKARLNVIGFAGLAPVKEEGLFTDDFSFLKYSDLQTPTFKIPIIVKRPSTVSRIEVTINGGNTFNLDLLEDMGAVMEEAYNAKFTSVFFKTYIRTLIKYVAADAAAQAAQDKAPAALGPKAGAAAAVGAKKTADATEGADIRSGRYFPDKAFVGGVTLDPGTYTITLNFGTEKVTLENVKVEAGKLNLVEAVSLK
ncbi:hypothetical protein LQZ19_06430 [Treponema primitia]|uniref:hypothetical protein n=1 Tax=Treponema primitia TaxID=88058 RepID=UPI0039810E1C